MAKALDVVGDRWTLLIVRELVLSDGLRYTDLLRSLPGIATNLLTDRLRGLEKAGVVSREEAPPPIATTLYHLTARGKALRPVLIALGRWGGPLLAEAPDDDAFLGHWLALPAEVLLADRLGAAPATTVELRPDDGQAVTIGTVDGEVRARPGQAERADLIIAGPYRAIVRLLAGRLDPEQAGAAGLTLEGDFGLLANPASTGTGAAAS